ncbi:MAG: right-handed parallel beta-helix repeat-containing protein [Kiritimatiellales bacterium]|nr:right-handed parallel beta-helix repeat-containing protein [Kiritimatiellales bacterium]
MIHKTIFFLLLTAMAVSAAEDLQQQIDSASAGSTIQLAAGTYRQPLRIKKGISLKGEAGAVLEITSNEPAILIDSYKPVKIEGLTIKYITESKPKKGEMPYAVLVRAGNVTLQHCNVEALGDGTQCPCGVGVQDKSKVTIESCQLNGFEYTIQYWNGASGNVDDCIVMNSGHCGITIGNGSTVELVRNIVTGSRYHGIRCTGGKITADSNLVIRNRNRGFYIGNRSAVGTLSNNLIVDNASGINVFANSRLSIENNVIVRSSYAGLAIVDTAKLEIEGNMIADNEKGVVGFSEKKGKEVTVSVSGQNLVHGNKVETQAAKLPSKTVKEDPKFKDTDSGLFKTDIKDLGLEDPEALQKLWAKWQAALDGH